MKLYIILTITFVVATLTNARGEGSPEKFYKDHELYRILATGDAKQMEAAIKNGADPNYVALKGEPLLVRAIRRQKHEMVRTLLLNGANPNLRPKSLSLPAYGQAILNNDPQTLLFLLQNGAVFEDTFITNEYDSLKEFARNSGYMEILLILEGYEKNKEHYLKKAKPTVLLEEKDIQNMNEYAIATNTNGLINILKEAVASDDVSKKVSASVESDVGKPAELENVSAKAQNVD